MPYGVDMCRLYPPTGVQTAHILRLRWGYCYKVFSYTQSVAECTSENKLDCTSVSEDCWINKFLFAFISAGGLTSVPLPYIQEADYVCWMGNMLAGTGVNPAAYVTFCLCLVTRMFRAGRPWSIPSLRNSKRFFGGPRDGRRYGLYLWYIFMSTIWAVGADPRD